MDPFGFVPDSAGAVLTLMTLMESNTSIDPTTWAIYNAGAFGFIFIMGATGNLFFKPAMKAKDNEIEYLKGLVAKRDEDIKERDKLLEAFSLNLSVRTLPAMKQTAQAMQQIPDAGAGIRSDVHQLRDQVSELAELLTTLTEQGEA